MDKFFIQAAFKSLDDIDKEENKDIKKALIESRLRESEKRNKKSYIKKVAENDFEVGKTFDIDDFHQFKKLCKEDGYTVTKEDFDFYFNCLDEIRENNYYLLDEAKKRKIKKYPLGKGEHLNTCAGDPDVNTAAFNHATTINNGSSTTGLGEDIEKQKLEEKIPKELKKAYKRNNKSLYASKLDYNNPENVAMKLGYNDDDIVYNESPIDFENAEYTIISKEEAHEYEKPRNRWHLILYYKDGVEDAPQALRFDRNGKSLEKFNFYSWGSKSKNLPSDSKRYSLSTLLPISWLIENADIIYYTDELDHLNDKYFKDLKKEDNPNKDVKNILDYWDSSLTSDEKRARNTLNLEFDDMPEYERRKQILRKIYGLKDNLRYHRKDKEQIEKGINLLKKLLYKNISPSEYITLKNILMDNNPASRTDSPINLKLARVIALKNNLKKKIDIFKAKAPLAQEEKGYTDNWDYKFYNEQIVKLEAQIKKLEQDIERYRERINSLDKDKLNKQIEDETNKLGDEIEKIDKELTGYGLKSVFKESVDKTKFNLKDPEDIEEAKKIKDEEDSKDDLIIIHPALNHKKPAPGDAIITCKACDEVFYLDKNELKQDPNDPDIYNKDLQCENCGAQDGYDYVGDVALKDTESAEEAIKEKDTSLEDDFDSKDSDNDVKELEPIDNTEEPEEIIEESFDKLVNKYLNKIYENIDFYKTSSITQTDRNNYLIEGIFKLNDNNKIKTSFLLEVTEKKNNGITLKGSNEILAESKEPFEIKGKVDNKKLIFESFKYNYVENIDKEQYLVEGLEENN